MGEDVEENKGGDKRDGKVCGRVEEKELWLVGRRV